MISLLSPSVSAHPFKVDCLTTTETVILHNLSSWVVSLHYFLISGGLEGIVRCHRWFRHFFQDGISTAAGLWKGPVYCFIFLIDEPRSGRSILLPSSRSVGLQAGPPSANLLDHLHLVIMLPTLVMVPRLWNGELEFICACFGCCSCSCSVLLVLHFWHEPFNSRFRLVSEYMSTASSFLTSHPGIVRISQTKVHLMMAGRFGIDDKPRAFR